MNPPASEFETQTFPVEQLSQFIRQVLRHFEISEEDAQQSADVLIASDVRGIDSHGIARLPMYARWLRAGRINPRPQVAIVRETPSTATVDGDNGLGLVVGNAANDIAMEKAAEVGTGWVAVRNSNHFGIAGYYPMKCLARDMIGWAMTNASCQVAPLWSRDRMLGTNPIAVAFPAGQQRPIVIDMATSVVAYGKVEIAQRKQVPIPDGWAIDAQGRVTNDASICTGLDYALLPLGGDRDHGGHKGYCLASMVDLLCGVLSGASWGPFAPNFFFDNPPRETEAGVGLGHFFGAMRIDGFIDADEFKSRADHWIRSFRNANPTPNTSGPLIPGQPEWEAEQQRRRGGIPLLTVVVDKLKDLSCETGIAFD